MLGVHQRLYVDVERCELHALVELRRGHRANGRRHGVERYKLRRLSCRNLLPRWHNAQDGVRER